MSLIIKTSMGPIIFVNPHVSEALRGDTHGRVPSSLETRGVLRSPRDALGRCSGSFAYWAAFPQFRSKGVQILPSYLPLQVFDRLRGYVSWVCESFLGFIVLILQGAWAWDFVAPGSWAYNTNKVSLTGLM